MFFSQIPSSGSSSGSTQTWAAVLTTIVGAIAAVLAKKRFGRPSSAINSKTISHQPVSHAELQTGLDQMRDRVTAGYMALGQKMDDSQKAVLAAIADHSGAVEMA